VTDHRTTIDAPTAGDVHGDGHGARTPVPMTTARFDDPHMQPATRHPQRAEGIIGLFFLLGIAGVAGFGAAYWVDAEPWVIATTFGIGLFCLGFGLTAWGKYLMPQGPFVEDRHPLAGTDEERDAMAAAVEQRGVAVVARRKVLGGLLAIGVGVFGIVALFPLLRSMGPLPGDVFEVTNWKKNSRLVDSNGRPIHVDDIQPGGTVTVFPEGYQFNDQDQAVDQTVLIRVQSTPLPTQAQAQALHLGPGSYLPDGRESWTPAGYVAYSQVCTHLGCPARLYERELELLVCPCHQSMFNVRNGAVPQFGPAPRPLPQLPLKVDDQGFLRSQTGYDQPVGPGFWERTQEGNGTA